MPYRPNERQYRDFSVSNFKTLDNGDEQSYVVRGYYTVFGVEYELCKGYYESVDRNALDNMDANDVLFQFNHGGQPLARIRNNSLRIGVDDVGGWAEADLGGSRQGRDIYEAISNGLIDRMSFGFTIADDGFEWDEDADGNIHSHITSVAKLYDVSCVDLPANDNTSISARSYLDGAIEARRKQQEVLRRAEDMRQRKAAAAERLKGLSLL